MIRLLVDFFFGCRHRRITRPMTPVRKPRSEPGDTYVVCLDCGQQFRYDTAVMRLGTRIAAPGKSSKVDSFQSSYK